ncbi:FUN14 family-domain-containing protein [Radiomyces spectabilis]|uniref:FUN14 family-domain-containing protein n=1 Tax=Radiomyces spectabilis TaxID=64574 RepID=UPI00221E7552|nr:FUN14 family-domain-containing protein [Radiomyces spectabilis]KAI8367641.1 FUN14 family-domain-containing protein [Radiomyces spectabilis]
MSLSFRVTRSSATIFRSFAPNALYRSSVPSKLPSRYLCSKANALIQHGERTASSACTRVHTSKICAMATATCITGFSLFKEPVACEGLAPPAAATQRPFYDQPKGDSDAELQKSLLPTGELSLGAILGFSSGYLVKKLGKLFALVLGVGFVFLQYCSSQGYVNVHWRKLEQDYRSRFDRDRDGAVTRKDLSSIWQTYVNFLTERLPFKASFLVGLYAGIRYG